MTRTGKLGLREPRDRGDPFPAVLFERYKHSETVFVAALAEMRVRGVSARKARAIGRRLRGHKLLDLRFQCCQQRSR